MGRIRHTVGIDAHRAHVNPLAVTSEACYYIEADGLSGFGAQAMDASGRVVAAEGRQSIQVMARSSQAACQSFLTVQRLGKVSTRRSEGNVKIFIFWEGCHGL